MHTPAATQPAIEPMSSAERLSAALAGQPVDRVPWSPFLAYVWENFPADIQQLGQERFLRDVGADPLWRGSPCPVALVPPEAAEYASHDDGSMIRGRVKTPVGSLTWAAQRSTQGNTAFLVEHPLKTAEDFKTQLWIEEHTRLRYDDTHVRQHFATAGRQGLSLGMLLPRGKSAFQSLIEHHVGTEELQYALADFPQVVEQLLAVMVQRDLDAVRLAMQCDAYDYWITWEDSSTQNYSPAQYRTYIASEITQWCAILQQHGRNYIQHACGHLRAILSPMLDQGIAAVESISPPPTGNLPIKDARALLGRGAAIIGGIEPTQFLNLPIDALDDYVEQVIADAAGGPFILANSDSCPPGVTMAKFARVGQIVRQPR